MMEKYIVSSVGGDFYVSTAGVDALLPFFKAEWDKFISELQAKPGNAQPPMLQYVLSAKFPDEGEMLAALMVIPFMSYSNTVKGDKLSVDAFAKQFGNLWFGLKKGTRVEQKSILDTMVCLVDVASKSIGAYDVELGMVSGHRFPIYVPTITEAGGKIYESLDIEYESVTRVTSMQPSIEPIVYSDVPWGAGCSSSFKAAQSYEVNKAFVAQANAASSDAYVVDPYLATAYLAWKAL